MSEVEERARAAAQEAAELAAARVLYEAACEDLDVEPQDFKGLPEEKQAKWTAKAAELLAPLPNPVPSPYAPAPAAPAPGEQPTTSNPDTLAALAGGVKVEERDPDEDPEQWEPEHSHVLLKVQRGNMGIAPKVPIDMLAPDVSSNAGIILTSVVQGFLQAQQQGNPTHPIGPNGSYGLQLPDGRVLSGAARLRLADFAETLEEDPSLPGLTCTLVDVGEAARTASVQQQDGPAGVGNPVVIQGGTVIGKPVAGGAPQPQPGPPQAGQGMARV